MFLKHVKHFSNTNNWHASSSLTWYLRMRVGRWCVTAYLTLLPAMRASWSISVPQRTRMRTKQLLVLVPSSFLPFQSGRSNFCLAILATSDFNNCIFFPSGWCSRPSSRTQAHLRCCPLLSKSPGKSLTTVLQFWTAYRLLSIFA